MAIFLLKSSSIRLKTNEIQFNLKGNNTFFTIIAYQQSQTLVQE